MAKKYHYIYIIRHKNGKYYVGRHSTNNIDAGYMGSGKWIRSIEDKSALTKIIIEYFDNINKLKIAEQLLIEQYFGSNGCMNFNKSSCGAASGENNHMFGKKHSEETKRKMSKENNHMYNKFKVDSPAYGRKHSEETKRKISSSQSGEKCRAANLNNIKVSEIKKLILSGIRNDIIAEQYQTSPTTISLIKHNKRWKYVI